MERIGPFLADTNGPYKQIMAAEHAAQSLQAWIQEKKDALLTIKKQAHDQGRPYKAINGDAEQLEVDIGRFKHLLECNEASRKHWREMHMAAWRATVRPLKIVDMPNEILQMIFANFKDDGDPQIQVDSSSFDDPLPSPDVTSIKRIRLTSRAFCALASEILLPLVDVSFTRSSLHRLEEISSHPSVSKSVRVLRIHANPYNPLLGTDRYSFVEETHSELRNLSDRFEAEAMTIEEEMVEILDAMTPETRRFYSTELESRGRELKDIKVALREASRVIATLSKVAFNPELKVSLNPYEDQISKAVHEAHEEYGRRCLEQQNLMNNPHVLEKIIKAVTQMPNVQRLCIPDDGSHHWDNMFKSGRDKQNDAEEYADAMRATNPFWDLMVHGGYRDESLFPLDEEPLLPLLHKLPLVLQVPSENLTHLDINLPPLSKHDTEILAEHLLNLRNSFQKLKSVQITILETYLDTEDRDSDTSLAMVYPLIETMLVSPRLEVVKLDHRMRGEKSISLVRDHSIGSVLANLPWNNVRSLCLNEFPLKVEELRQVLRNVPGRMHIELSRIFLLEGTWAEALEILRDSADSSSRVIQARGVETKSMSKRERRDFRSKFKDEDPSIWKPRPGPASLYIQGGNIPNPLIRGND